MSPKIPKIVGFLLTIFLSLAVLTAFYGNLFGKLNQVSFAKGGDGLQSYVNMDYHIRFDTTYMRCNSMNYPFGEHVFFTNNQPLISNSIRFISRNIIDISGYTLGILNFIMLFCLVIAPLILFLIMTQLGMGTLISSLASVGIAYLSPQIDRFGGHFSLSYVCVIPLIIYLLLKFFSKPTVGLSIIISFVVFAGALTHFYIYGFFAILIIFFYGTYLWDDKKIFGRKILFALHFFLQLVLPYLVLQLMYFSDHVTDRPQYPWGFLVYRAYPQSIFLPFGRPYGGFLYSLVNTGFIDWEGYAFVGMLAVIGTGFILYRFLKKILRLNFKDLWKVTPHRQINIMFWASVAALLYSFGLPFILGLQWLIDLIGPIRQMRGIARFSWIFFYVINIVTLYGLWMYWKSTARKLLPLIVTAAGIFILYYDAWINVRNRGMSLENHIPVLVDRSLLLPENQWINHHDLSRYQAIIPIPFFHIGSENIWIDGDCDIVNQSFMAIDNSGLPCMGAMLSRTSISQTVELVGLMLGPSSDRINMSIFPSQKPFLILAARCEKITGQQRQMIDHSQWIDSSGHFDLYEMPYNAFTEIADSTARAIRQEFAGLELFDHERIFSTEPRVNYYFDGFENMPDAAPYDGSGCYSGRGRDINEIFNGRLAYADTSRLYSISFWMDHVRQDIYPRTNMTIIEKDSLGNIVFNETSPVFKNFVMVDSDWVMVEFKFILRVPDPVISVSLQNTVLRNKPVKIDNLLIKPENTIIYQSNNDIRKNNGFAATKN